MTFFDFTGVPSLPLSPLFLVPRSPPCRLLDHPAQVALAASYRGNGNDLGNLVRVLGFYLFCQGRNQGLSSLDDHQNLAVLLDFALPGVDRGDSGEQVDARREPLGLLDEVFGKRAGDLGARGSAVDDGDVS